jgi:hypothetical protein
VLSVLLPDYSVILDFAAESVARLFRDQGRCLDSDVHERWLLPLHCGALLLVRGGELKQRREEPQVAKEVDELCRQILDRLRVEDVLAEKRVDGQ